MHDTCCFVNIFAHKTIQNFEYATLICCFKVIVIIKKDAENNKREKLKLAKCTTHVALSIYLRIRLFKILNMLL